MRTHSLATAVLFALVAGIVCSAIAKDPAPSTLQRREAQQIKARKVKIAPADMTAVAGLKADRRQPRAGAAASVVDEDNKQYVVVNIEFRDAESCRNFDVEGVTAITRFDRFADVFVPDDRAVLAKLDGAPGVRWLEVDRWGVVPPPARPVPKKETPRALPEPIVRGGLDGLSGKGVVVAVIDTGIDFHHDDFIDYDSTGRPTSRVLYYWDTSSEAYATGVGEPAPIKYPNGSPIGTVFSGEDLTRELRGEAARIPVWDVNGHGTACAGIAAGNGNHSKGKYAGVAPKADIVVVRIASDSAGGVMDNGFVTGAACQWLDKIAGQRPLVVSCSWGGQYGGRDGYRIQERQIDARFPLDRAGRAICFAAGNEGDLPIHGGLKIKGSDAPGTLTWNAPDGGELEIYIQSDNQDDLRIGALGDTRLGDVSAYVHGLTGELVVTVSIGAGEGGLYLFSDSGKTYDADGYIYGGDAQFLRESASFKKLVGSPGTTTNAITVGSYDWNEQFNQHGRIVLIPDFVRDEPLRIGALSAYSSPGPRRIDDITKPEIAAPGQWYTAPAPTNISAMRDSTGFYQLFNGTSAATPYTAGVVALLMERRPALKLGEIKRLLQSNVTTDARTGDVPNASWGYGKLDMKAVKKLLGAAR